MFIDVLTSLNLAELKHSSALEKKITLEDGK